MEIILDILYIFAVIYTLYFLALAIRNLNDTAFSKEKRLSLYEEKDNIAVVIYSHNNRRTLANLVREIKSQDYPINNFKVFLLLDNCTDGSQEMFIEENFIRVVDIKGVGTVGKDQAVSILLEQLSQDDLIDSYVFIDADRSISTDFLSTVNAALAKSSVISGETIIDVTNLGPIDKVKAVYQKYHMNFIRKARSLFGLAAQADSGVFIIKHQLVKQIGDVDFKDINSELKYSLLLSKVGQKCTYNPNIQTVVDTTNYTFRKPRLSCRLDLFKNCISQMFSKNFVFTEHALSLLYPNFWLVMLIYCGIMKHSFNYYFFVDFKIVLLTFLILIAAFGISLINAKLTIKEIGLLCLYPVYSLCHIVNNLPPVRKIKSKIKGTEDLPEDTEKMVVDVVVSAGAKDLNCKLEFISEKGLCKVRFIFKNKKFTTSSHLRMIDALQELKMKLDDYGFILKICSCCSHYTPYADGSTNMLKGHCSSDYPSPSIKEPKPTLIWNTCTNFTPAKLNNIISEMITQGQSEE